MGSTCVTLEMENTNFYQCFLAVNHEIQFHFAIMPIEDIACHHQAYSVYASVFKVYFLSLNPELLNVA